MKGIFIVLEGPDGSGKTTIIEYIADYLKKRNIDFITTREPGGTEIGERIRSIILDKDNEDMTPETEALLYAAARAQHVNQKILPALKKGKVVLCERFVLSSLAYQGIGRQLGIEQVEMINNFAIRGLKADLTLFFYINPITSLNRKTKEGGGDRLENEGLRFHGEVYNGYMELLRLYSESIQRVDATGSIEEVFKQTIHHIENVLKRRNIM